MMNDALMKTKRKRRLQKMGKCRYSSVKMREAVKRGEMKGPDRHDSKVGGRRKTETNNNIERDWKNLQDSAPVKGIENYKKEWFLDAMEDMLEVGYHPSRFDKYRQAVSDQCVKHLPADKHWNNDRCFASKFATIKKRAMTSYMKMKSMNAKKVRKKPMEDDDDPDDMLRGAITGSDKGVQLVEHLAARKMWDMMHGVIIAHAGLLRHQELKDADHKNFYIEGGKWYLKVIGGKWRDPWHIDHVLLDGADQTLQAIVQLGGKGPLFQNWDENAIRREIAICAKINGWDANRKWDFHCLRHGKAVDNRLMGLSLEERMKRGRWSSAKTEHTYSRYR